MKLNISINDELAARIDEYAKSNYMTRSAFISFCCTKYLNEIEVMSSLKNVTLAIRKIAETGQADLETLKELEEFEKFSQVLLQSKFV